MTNTLLDTAVEACRAAGAVHREFQHAGFTVGSKELDHDPVTEVDLAAESTIVSLISQRFPDHGILAEEGGESAAGERYRWIIDPLDGTSNFSRGIPYFSVSVGVYENDRPLVGVVYDPSRDELFSAVAGKGASVNGKPIQVSDVHRFTEALLVTGFHYERGPMMERNLETIRRFLRKDLRGIRRFGSAALDLCYVACGRTDGFWEHGLSLWDYAAGSLIVSEAGGSVADTITTDGPSGYLLASNRKLHGELLAEIARR